MLATLLFILIAPAQSQGNSQVNPDSRLDAKVSLRARITSLTDAAKLLSSQSGTELRVASNLNDRKLCLYFKNESVRTVMSRIACLFDGEWAKEGNAYRLTVPSKILQLETDLLHKEALAKRAFAEKRVLSAIRFYNQYTQSELSDLIAQAKDDLAAAKTDPSPQGKKSAADLQAKLDELLTARADYSIGCILSQVNSLDGLWNGRIIVGATEPFQGQPRLPDSKAGAGVVIKTKSGSEATSTGALELIRYSLLDGSLASHQQILFQNDAGGFKLMTFYARPPADPYAALKEHPFRVLADAWSTPAAEVDKLPIMDTPLDAEKREHKLDYPLPDKMVSLSEQIEWLHDATGLPMIAEPFRHPIEANAAFRSAPTLRAWIGQFANGSEGGFRGYLRVEERWLCFRQEDFWRHRTDEIPERIIAPFEAKSQGGKPLTFDEYGAFATQLNDRQLQALKSLDGPDAVLLRFFSDPLADSGKALRIWGSLDPVQKSEATQPGGLSVSRMHQTQKQLYWDTLYDAVWEAIIVNTRLRNAALYGGDREAEGACRFFVSRETYRKPAVQFANLPEGKPDPFTGFRMHLGPSPEDSISYWCRTER